MTIPETILVLGAGGQIGTDLVDELRTMYGGANVIATDIKEQKGSLSRSGPFHLVDVLEAEKVYDLISKNNVTQVYLLAALLSAVAEQKIKTAWKLNVDGLFVLLDI